MESVWQNLDILLSHHLYDFFIVLQIFSETVQYCGWKLMLRTCPEFTLIHWAHAFSAFFLRICEFQRPATTFCSQVINEIIYIFFFQIISSCLVWMCSVKVNVLSNKVRYKCIQWTNCRRVTFFLSSRGHPCKYNRLQKKCGFIQSWLLYSRTQEKTTRNEFLCVVCKGHFKKNYLAEDNCISSESFTTP